MYPKSITQKALGSSARADLGNMPEVSEMEIIRHFTRLSTWNYAIDPLTYPLGSCTMKYNARVNEVVARFPGLANAHPYQPAEVSQGAMRVMKTLSDCLLDITGMDAITLQPAAGAHGEMTGILLMHAYLQSKGNPRKKILIPDSAHETNPATAAICGYAVENLKSNSRGMVDVSALAAQMNEDVAGLMLTNPNTLGIFEQEIHKIAEIPSPEGRSSIYGWRQHECFGRQDSARRFWRGRNAPEPTQDFFHAAWRRRTRIGARGLQEDPGTVPAQAGDCGTRRRDVGVRL